MITRNAVVISISIVLLVVSVALVLLSREAIIPDGGVSVEPNASFTASTENQPFAAIYDTEINGMSVRYYILPERNLDVVRRDYPDDAILKRGYSYDLIPNVNICTVRVTEEYLASTDVASGILGSLGRCYGEIALGFPTGNLLADEDYVNRWVREYRGACDDSSESFVPSIINGSCENIPVFEGAPLTI